MTAPVRLAPHQRIRFALAIAIAVAGLLPLPVNGQSPAPSDAPAGTFDPDAPCFLLPSDPAASPDPGDPSPRPGGSPPPVRQGTIPAAGGVLTPGTYQDWSLGPTLSFEVGDCWAATPVDAGFGLALIWGGSPAAAVLSLTQFEGLVFQDPCLAQSQETLALETTADALVGDLLQSPYLIVGEPIETVLGGFPALRLEVATQQPMGCEPPETWIWASPAGGGFVLGDGQQATFLLADIGERVIVVAWETFPGGDFEGLTRAADAIVATLAIDPTTDPGPSALPSLEPSPQPAI